MATTVPNFARGALVPVTGAFTGMTGTWGLSPVSAAMVIGFVCFGAAFAAIKGMDETYGKDLDYLEVQMVERKEQNV